MKRESIQKLASILSFCIKNDSFTWDVSVSGLDTGLENKDIILQIWMKPLELSKILVPVEQAAAFAVEVDFNS